MTSNQIEAAKVAESRRSNQAKEREEQRSNKAREYENTAERKRKQRQFTAEVALDIAKTAIGAGQSAASNAAKVAPAVIAAANDPSWYKVSDQVVKDAASISTFQPTGTLPVDDAHLARINDGDTSRDMYDGHRYAVSGLMLLHYIPTIGNSSANYSNADPVNIAAQNIYSYVRHANSGSKNYERADYMMYLQACDSVISYYAFMRRIYGICMSADVFNVYRPKKLVELLGVDYEDIIGHLSDLRSFINTYVVRSNVLAMPSDYPMYARHAFLASNLFTDSASKKHQIYVFNPFIYYRWEIDPANDATMLKGVDPFIYNETTTLLKFSDIVAFGNNLLKSLVDEEDVGIMAGDTLKAFGEAKLLRLPEVPDMYQTPVVYSTEILDQINNLTFVKKEVACMQGSYQGTAGWVIKSNCSSSSLSTADDYSNLNTDIHQDVGQQAVYQNLIFSRAVYKELMTEIEFSEVALLYSNAKSVELNFTSDRTSPDDVMVGTRLTNTILPTGVSTDDNGNPLYSYTVQSCGSEIIWNGFIVRNFYNVTTQSFDSAVIEIYDGKPAILVSQNVAGSSGSFRQQPQIQTDSISDFDWHPKCYMPVFIVGDSKRNGTSSAAHDWTTIMRPSFWFDRNMSTWIDEQVIAKLHRAALLGEYNIAEMGIVPRSGFSVR